MPLSPLLATWLVDLGHDAVHAVSIGLATSSDTQVIETARRERRTIVTADLDYPRLLASARSTEPSLILFRGGNWSEADYERGWQRYFQISRRATSREAFSL
jgi:predicted nuclease of predicted toxin-antitoxin system